MANPTTNYGWQMPTSTDLVTDLPADFEVFGQAVDTSLLGLKGGTTGQVLSKTSGTDMAFTWATDSSGIPATIVDAKGDIIAATAADAVSRLAVGANATVLTADSTAATGMKWAAAAAANASYSLINAGGTALTAASTITVSGISGMNKIQILIQEASSTSAGSAITMRFNTDTSAKYTWYSASIEAPPAYATTFLSKNGATGGGSIALFDMSSNTASNGNGYLFMDGANNTGSKAFHYAIGASGNTGSGQIARFGGGVYTGASTISSVSIISSFGNFDGGTIYIYGSAA